MTTLAELEFEQTKALWNLWAAKRLPKRGFRVELDLGTAWSVCQSPALLAARAFGGALAARWEENASEWAAIVRRGSV